MPVSYKYAMPNKFFESVAAGLAIVTGPSPEMARLTQKYGFGVVAPGFETCDLANVLNGLNHEQINDMKLRALAASEVLNADVEMGKLLNIYRRLIRK
jgi:glycosyltransferase involved in cell wall biosynthesis